jgi:hypothetical protein
MDKTQENEANIRCAVEMLVKAGKPIDFSDAEPVQTKQPKRASRMRAPGLDDGENPFHPIPGKTSAGEY